MAREDRDLADLEEARVLLELGDLREAEATVSRLLEAQPEELAALNLLAKIKHIRGELSQAIACWAQMYTRAPMTGTARQRLESMLRLAMDPERGAADFVALGRSSLAAAPLAHLELEQAFALLLARRPAEAVARCERLAFTHRARDREVFKLAVLAAAWVAELGGDLERACRILERLGEEPGFATDVDRVLALVGLYGLVGTPSKLEAAIHICLYLRRRYRSVTVLSDLGVLYRRLGDHARAARYDAEYLRAFRHRMNRPTRAEVLAVASRRYLPLARLLELRLPEDTPEPDLGPRERAIADVLRGDRLGARSTFARLATALDERYLGDLALLSGDGEGAVRLYLRSLQRGDADEGLVFWLLDHHATTREVATHFRAPEVAARTRQLLEARAKAEPKDAATWRRLATVVELAQGPSETAVRFRARALAQEAAEARERQPIGRVLAAAVYRFVGRQRGLIHEVWADRSPAAEGHGGVLPSEHLLGNLTPEMERGVLSIFISVREYAQVKFPHLTRDLHDHRYAYKVTKEDETSHGVSAGLPTALAFLSVFLQRPVPQDVAMSGMLVTDAHDVLTVRPVGDTEHKVKAAYNRNLRRLLLPAGNRLELEANPRIPRAILTETVRFVRDLDDAVREVFGDEVFWWGEPRRSLG